jgi:hypothetical protein
MYNIIGEKIDITINLSIKGGDIVDLLEKRLINYKDESWGEGEKRVERHLLVLENILPDTSWEQELNLYIPIELVQKHKLNDYETLNSLRGETIQFQGTLYDQDSVSVDSSKTQPKIYKNMRFKVKEINFPYVSTKKTVDKVEKTA